MGSQERRQRERELIREKILDAARELFSLQGFEAVTMRQIAKKIEYTPTAIYFHFKDKEALLRELCTMDFRALQSSLTRIAKNPDPIVRLRRMGQAYVDFALTHPNHYRLMFMEPCSEVEIDLPISRGNPDEDTYAFLKETVAEAMTQGRFREDIQDVALVAQVMWSSMHGIASLYLCKINDPWVDWKPVKRTTQMMIETIIRGLTVAEAR